LSLLLIISIISANLLATSYNPTPWNILGCGVGEGISAAKDKDEKGGVYLPLVNRHLKITSKTSARAATSRRSYFGAEELNNAVENQGKCETTDSNYPEDTRCPCAQSLIFLEFSQFDYITKGKKKKQEFFSNMC
jgi:hypothetical protein